jgi:hypothetical protein
VDFVSNVPFYMFEPLLPVIEQDAEEYLSVKALRFWKPRHLGE